MKKDFRFTMVMATAAMLLALTGCEGTGTETTVATPVTTVEATPTEAPVVEATPTEVPVVEATPTEEVAEPTEAPVDDSLVIEIREYYDPNDNRKHNTIATLHEGDSFEFDRATVMETTICVVSEDVMKEVRIECAGDLCEGFQLTDTKVIKGHLLLNNETFYDNYEVKFIAVYPDGSEKPITVYFTMQ